MDKPRVSGWTSRIVLVILAFALLCTGVLLASFASSSSSSSSSSLESSQSEESSRRLETQLREDTMQALQETAQADLALRENNFGAAQVHIQRARVRLEAAVAELEEGTSGN